MPSKNYSTADGLPHDYVNKIMRDSRGFLWFCTGEGLSRFDGYEFKNYTQAHGLPHRSVNDLIELENGQYLLATGDGLTVFNPAGEINASAETNRMFQTFRLPNDTVDQRSIAISDLHKARNDEIWAATDIGLFRLSRENGGIWNFEAKAEKNWLGKTVEIYRVIDDRFGRIWIGSSIGLYIFDPKSGESLHVSDYTGESLLEDEKGRIWAGSRITPAPGLYLYDVPDGDSPPKLIRRFTTEDGLSDDVWILGLLKTSDNRILVGIRNGLCEFLPDAKPGEPSFRTLFSANVISLAEDGGGNVWVGTANVGAFKLTLRGFILYQMPEKQPYQGITSIFPGKGREIFATSSYADLLRFDGEKFTEIRLSDVKDRNWNWNQLDLRSRFDGEWWIPSKQGLFRYPAVERFEDLAHVKPKAVYTIEKNSLLGNHIFGLFEDSRGDIWFSVVDSAKNTLMRWERQSGKFHQYTTDHGIPPLNSARAFAEDSAGNIWLGFYSGGVARYKNGEFQLFTARTGFPTGLVNAIYADRKGRIWIAISNSGAVRVDNPAADEPQFIELNINNGLSSNQANCITEDNFGRIYIGTARGINRLEPETGRFKLYTQADGLPGSAIGRCARDEAGNLWFSQKFTLARLTVQADKKPPPPIFIDNFRVNGMSVKKLSELGETSIQDLDFTSEQRQIQITFFAVGFGTGETLQYQYRLNNSDWSEPSAQRQVTLDLAAGNYNFEVRAVNAEGITSENPAQITFTIARPFWQRWWFLVLAATIIVAVIYMIHRYRLQRLLELERVRTRLATDLHDDIGASLSQIAILAEVVRRKGGTDAVKEPLDLIADTSREMVDSMSDIVWAINPRKDHLPDLTQRMRRFAEDSLDAQEIEYRFIVQENLKSITLGADLRRDSYLMFKECVNNLVKHASASAAKFEIKTENNFLIIKIEDDGRGFVPSEKLNGNAEGYGGNGLINLKQRAEKLNAHIKIESETGRGTKITIEIPIT